MRGCFDLGSFVLDTVVMKKICKYHKRRGQQFTENDVVRDFCPDAFFVAYPYALALLYGAEDAQFKRGRIQVRCPNPRGIIMEVLRAHCRTLPMRLVKRVFDWIVARVIYPVDWEDCHVRVRVVESAGGCPCDYIPGTSYWFNIRRLDELCPASFHGIYPFLLLAGIGLALPWGTQSGSQRIHCPDHEGIIYDLKWLTPPATLANSCHELET